MKNKESLFLFAVLKPNEDDFGMDNGETAIVYVTKRDYFLKENAQSDSVDTVAEQKILNDVLVYQLKTEEIEEMTYADYTHDVNTLKSKLQKFSDFTYSNNFEKSLTS